MSRASRCQEMLELAEELCLAGDLLAWTALETQSGIAMELAAWHELLDDVDDLQSRLHAFVAGLEPTGAERWFAEQMNDPEYAAAYALALKSM